ncbi:MAG TPA: diacylglycerol kinase family protein [Actinomycetota bacterium]|nr:diacylglycerol kinase family protein [Actinomycetota bacterium]
MTSPFGDLAVIADRAVADLALLERALEARGLRYRLQVSRDGSDATRLATAALDEGYRYLTAVGDDRTVQDVVNGMFRDGHPVTDDPVLGVVPAMGPCDLTRSFGLPEDVDGAVGHLVGENTYPFDVMKVSATRRGAPAIRYATNVAQVGFHAGMARNAARLPRWLGGGRRFLGFWSAYATQRVRDVTLKLDNREHLLRSWSIIVGNGQFDAGLRMSPRSFPGDGVLDVLAFVGPKGEAYRLLPRIFRHGDHVPADGIKELRIRIAGRIESDRPMPVVIDGASFGTTPVALQVVPQTIRFKL